MGRLKCGSWREEAPSALAALYEAEARRWRSTLSWDVTVGLAEVERGRQHGTVPGYVVRNDADAIVAWCYYIAHRATLQIGGFVAESEAASLVMLDALFASDTRAGTSGVTFFAFAQAPELVPALRRRGLTVDRYWYLARELRPGAPGVAAPGARRWRSEDATATAELLMRAYPTPDEARPFAPRGTREEWTEYARQLTGESGCGRLMPELCVSVPEGPSRLVAAALVTRLADDTAHVAQLAVDPTRQRRGLATALIAGVCADAGRAGCRRLTLLVGGRNSRARALYRAAGFDEVASFVAAGQHAAARPTPSTSLRASST